MPKALLCGLCMWFFAGHLFAERLDRPYVVDVPVTSQSSAERGTASLQGLQQLLLKLTGKAANENPVIQQRLASGVDQYLLQFSYEKGAVIGGYLQPSPFVLRLSFSQTAVLQLLHDADLTLWPLDRPRLLLLMLDTQGNWMPAAGQNIHSAQLRQLGAHYGVPIVTPILDVQDMTDISVQAVQSADAPALQTSVIRYQTDALLTGVVSGDDVSGWQGQWTLQFRDARIPLQKQAASLPLLLDTLFMDVTAQLSGQYRDSTSHDTGASTVRLQVEAIDSYGQYTQLRNYLEKLDAVKHLHVSQVVGSTVTMDVDVTGEESFRSLLGLSRQLVNQDAAVMAGTGIPPAVAPPATANPAEAASVPAAPVMWRYRWTQ